ncbi:MAG: TIGR00730 family Rossman fold protein [Anaerolineaceae bacterium]|nr:TIGR00730 family Rossman fold protein [Anaerolineaceae bacterium]
MKLKTICVYCGSSPGRSPAYSEEAKRLGEEIARRGMRLVYGGASVGLMGEVARAAVANGGKVIGVIPAVLFEQEIADTALENLIVVESMHERKAKMAELADGFIAMPGGFGTLDEVFEMLTWEQLGLHAKPCGLLNIENYYEQLLAFLDHAVEEMFIYKPHREMILLSKNAGELIDQMAAYDWKPIKKSEWVRAMKKYHRA